MGPQLVIPGSEIITLERHSPLTLAVVLFVAGMVPLAYWQARRKGMRGTKLAAAVGGATLAAVMVVVLAALVPYTMIKPDLMYGSWLNGTTLYTRFYGTHIVKASICNATIELVPRDRLGDILSVRTNGLGDPLAHISMGYFRTRDGRRAYVVVVGEKPVVIVDAGRYVVAVGGFDNPEDFYHRLLDARARLCGKS